MAREISLAQESKITILKIKSIECKGEVEKESPIARWLCYIVFHTFSKISRDRFAGRMYVEDISDKAIKTGTYSIVSQNYKDGFPLFKKTD